jgi:hypothetical protein
MRPITLRKGWRFSYHFLRFIDVKNCALRVADNNELRNHRESQKKEIRSVVSPDGYERGHQSTSNVLPSGAAFRPT